MRLEAISTRLGGHCYLGWRPSLLGHCYSIAIRLEAIDIRLEAIAIRNKEKRSFSLLRLR